VEGRGRQLGVVGAIVGLDHGRFTVIRRADHAGTMPMVERQNVLAAATGQSLGLELTRCSLPGRWHWRVLPEVLRLHAMRSRGRRVAAPWCEQQWFATFSAGKW
jgi:hypothetical protein